MEVEVCEAVVLREIVCYSALSSTDSCEFLAGQKYTSMKIGLPPHKPINILQESLSSQLPIKISTMDEKSVLRTERRAIDPQTR
jgi:hypothetical protein